MTPDPSEMPEDVLTLLMEYTRNSKADVLRFIGAANACGYKFVSSDLAPTSQWREISTLKYAPMSGYVLLCVGHGSIFIGLRNVYGDVVCTEIGKDGHASKCGATHWMALPLPPTKDLAAAEKEKS